MKIASTLALALVSAMSLAVGASGCGDDDDGVAPGLDASVDTTPPPPPPPPFDGGGDVTTGDSGPGLPPVAKGPSNGSAIAVSADESRIVVCNRDKGSVTVLGATYAAGQPPSTTKVAEIDLGAGSEPWQVAIASSGDKAFVVTRRGQKLVRIDGLNTTPVKGPEVTVGSEPTGVALTPRSTRVWVSNWVDGTLMEVNATTMAVLRTVDLNAAIAPLLGTGITARPALAHPRSVAVTNNGNDDEGDETVYATEFYAVRKDPESGTGQANNADTSKQGIVYAVKVSTGAAQTIPLAPLADMGFAPFQGGTAGCFPNQLQSITVSGKFAYVVSVCASPKGPVGVRSVTPLVRCNPANGNADCAGQGNIVDGVCVAAGPGGLCADVASVKTTTAPLISVIDTTTNTEVTAAATNLNKRFTDRYVAANVANDASRRLPLYANDLAFVPGASIAYVSANGSDAVFRVVFDANTGQITEVGSTLQHFINLRPAGILFADRQGFLPMGVAVGSKGFAFTANDTSRNVSVIDLNVQTLAGGVAEPVVVASTARPATGSLEERVVKGRQFFNTGLGRWSLRGQAWGACQSCHPDGLSDNVTWYFARGPRQSTSLDGSFSKDGAVQRIFNWTAIFDDVADFEGNIRLVAGGIGALVKAVSSPLSPADRIDPATAVTGERHDNLNGSAQLLSDPADPFALGVGQKSLLADWLEIADFMKTIRAPRAARNLDPGKVTAGRGVFQNANCQGCHGGPLWTTSELFYARTAANAFTTTQALSTTTWNEPTFPSAISPLPTGATTGPMRASANTPNDSLLCALRHVGTFETAEDAVGTGGKIPELRADMTTAAQGGGVGGTRGYSPPSLLGVSVGAPYLHGGNARTLEALFSETFNAHHRALSVNFLAGGDAADRRAELIQFLLSVDDDATVIAPPAVGATGGKLCASP